MNNILSDNLGNLVKSGGGKIHTGPFGSQLHAADYVQEGIPCIMPANMKSNRVDLSDIAYITEGDANRLSKYIVKKDDIVYSRRGDVTLKALIREKEDGYFCGTGCLLLRPGDKFDSRFLTHYLSTPTIQNWIVRQAVGATMPNLNTGILASIPFNGPKKEEQEKIADVLSVIEDKIELNNRINSELEAMAKTLYDYWFVQFDFPDANGNPYKASGGKMVYNPVLKREIPQGWCVCELGEHITFERGISYRSKDIAETGTPLMNLNSFALTGKFKPNGTKYFSGSYKPEKLCNIGDLVIAITDVTRNADIIGKGFIVPDAFEGKRALISCDVALVKSSYFGNAYLETLFNSNHYHNYIKQFASGTLVLHLDLKGVNWYRTELPPRELLSRFEDFCTPLFQQRDVVLQENKKLEELRDWLLPMLMNGQVTVTPSTEPQEAQHG
ncbi:restriction endonuclease subunit S [Vibrio cholerae]|uniref:restriction endonuclease subunit S n=2 Tax=Vibrio cholerae TaxID=666 RepID=UPI00021A9DA3|nr:restriction endonuclease subunit S [Vibrio cholerae]EGS59428.1 type I restriction modification DNA specificity domain protein [Vibrio cholerae HC-02A1]EKF9156920.1 restriction endonuclease subunit S [Vibrio cholerae]EKF9387673.1 restriction endonuclease subunit S [Vibrio cholerae]EKF9823548.1 restriction endonuclease subunit S [Vibrio cholerae]EKG58826.1 type I restriction modification DNA specificity domain protein [Vibrio cholerae HC-55A1]